MSDIDLPPARQAQNKPPDPAAARVRPPPRFVTGSIFRHVLVMSATGAIGLVAIFFGDLANIFFLGRLNDHEIVAAVGYASALLFILTSVGIGLAIAVSVLTAPVVGRGDMDRARVMATNTHIFAALVGVALAMCLWLTMPQLLALIGATGRTHQLAVHYMYIQIPSMVMLTVGFASGSVLRCIGDARRAMQLTLVGAAVNIVLDPILIFGLGLGIAGAGWASVAARAAYVGVGLWYVHGVHGMFARPKLGPLFADSPMFLAIAVPAISTNLATPVANAYITRVIAPYGDQAVAGYAITGRISAVAFAALFALSGSIGPIIGQNLGARRIERVHEVVTYSLIVNAIYTVFAWIVLAALAPVFVRVFNATGEAANLILLFCHWLAPLFGFLGALFIANAVFNQLSKPHYATAFNWTRATLGTAPLVLLGGWLGGASGVMTAQFIGGIVFGVAAIVVAFRLIAELTASPGPTPPTPTPTPHKV